MNSTLGIAAKPSTRSTGFPPDFKVQVADLVARAQRGEQGTVIHHLLSLIREWAPSAYVHGRRTATYALALGRARGLSGLELVHLHWASRLHDIGTLGLPPGLLEKDEPLTAEEFELVQCHPRDGAELLAEFPFLAMPAVWIAHHHERWDGAGYPYGVRGLFIPLASRILAVADTFDAILSEDCQDWLGGMASAINRLQALAGSQLDPALVSLFVSLPIASTRNDGIQCDLIRGTPETDVPLSQGRVAAIPPGTLSPLGSVYDLLQKETERPPVGSESVRVILRREVNELRADARP